MLGVPTSKPELFVLLVSSAAWVFCVPSAVFPEMAGVGETDGEILGVGVKIRLVIPLCALRRIRGRSLKRNHSAYCNLTLTHNIFHHIWNI